MTDPWDPNRNADPVPPVPPVPSAPPTAPIVYPPVSAPPTAPWPPQPTTPGQPMPGPPMQGGAPMSGVPMSGTPATAPLPVPYAPAAAGYGQPSPAGYGMGQPSMITGYGFDPLTGQPLSDKSKITAGLLQLILGFVFTLGGVGRLYAGNTALGVAQLVATLFAWTSFWCGFLVLFISWVPWVAIWLWFVIDGIVMLAGRPVDGQGRLLRS